MACCSALTPSNLPPAVVNRQYNQTITAVCAIGATNHIITLASGNLPIGLTFSSSTNSPAVISGRPRRGGTFTFTLKISGVECDDVFQTFTIRVRATKKAVGVTPSRISCDPTTIGGRPAVCCSSGSWYNPFEWATTVCSFGSR